MEYLPGSLYNFHPGSHVGQGVEKGIELVANQLNGVLSPEQKTIVLLETMSGKGSEVGRTFEELAAIMERIPEERRIPVPEEEAIRFACNAVSVGKHVVIPAGCPRTMQILRDRGYRTHAVELDEFMKSGGAAKCLTLALD